MKITKFGKTFTITGLRAQNLNDLAAACELALFHTPRMERLEMVSVEDAERYFQMRAWERARMILRRGCKLRSQKPRGGHRERKAVLH